MSHAKYEEREKERERECGLGEGEDFHLGQRIFHNVIYFMTVCMFTFTGDGTDIHI